MIFQIIDSATGVVLRTVMAPRAQVARLYLKDGEALFRGGPAALDRDRLVLADGVLVRNESTPADAVLNGEGDSLEAINAE